MYKNFSATFNLTVPKIVNIRAFRMFSLIPQPLANF